MKTNIEQDIAEFEVAMRNKYGWGNCADILANHEQYSDMVYQHVFYSQEAWQAAVKLQRERQASGEAVAWESITDAYTKYITQKRYEKFSASVKRWYRPYKCANCTAPIESDNKVREALEAEIARLNRFIENAFRAHPNLDLDIEALLIFSLLGEVANTAASVEVAKCKANALTELEQLRIENATLRAQVDKKG